MISSVCTIFSVVVLAAHAARVASPGGAAFWLAAGVLAVSPASWSNWVLAGLLGFGAGLWGEITLGLVQQRMAGGLPWLRLASILGVVTSVCLLAAFLNYRQACRTRISGSAAQGLAFLLTSAGLAAAREKTSMDILLVDRFFPTGGWVMVFLLGWYAAWIVGKMQKEEDSANWRKIIWAVFSAVFFLQLSLGLAGFEQFLMTGRLHLPVPALIAAGPLFRGDGFFMIILFTVTLLLVGPAWCSHLCYIGVWDNLAALGRKRAGTLPGWTKIARWLICAGVLGVAFLLGRSDLPVTVAVGLAAGFGIFGVVVMLVWSRRTGVMAHCTTYCPMGLLANIVGRINPWRIRIGSGCSRCGVCSGVCRYGALSAADIEAGAAGLSCSLCGDCIAGCPHGCLHYRFPGMEKTKARSAFIVVVVALHAIFLGVARL